MLRRYPCGDTEFIDGDVECGLGRQVCTGDKWGNHQHVDRTKVRGLPEVTSENRVSGRGQGARTDHLGTCVSVDPAKGTVKEYLVRYKCLQFLGK